MEATSTQARSYTCPEFCSPGMHYTGSADIEHREVPEVAVVPGGGGHDALTTALLRTDEIGAGGEQVCYPLEYELGYGAATVLLSGAELDVWIERLQALRQRGRGQQDVSPVPTARRSD